MRDDVKERALSELLLRVDQVANGPVSLEALYALETGFVYGDFWYSARERFREVIASRSASWVAELRRPPPDLKLWLPLFDRRKVTDAGIQVGAEQWATKGSERFFGPHHYVSGISEGVAALHVTLLADLDPIGAVEYAAALPSEYFGRIGVSGGSPTSSMRVAA